MTKSILTLTLISSLSVCNQEMPDRFLGHSVESLWGSIQTSINSFFEPKEDAPDTSQPEVQEEKDLSLFQQLFRNTITFTNNTANSLSAFAQKVMDEAKESILTIEDAADRFIGQVEDAGSAVMKKILNETLDVDLDLLFPSIDRIQNYITKLQRSVPKLENAPIKSQIEDMIDYLEHAQQNALSIQKAGIPKLMGKLASNALFDKKHKLVTQFKELYAVYPTVIGKVNDLHINETGKIAHTMFNNSSELVEQVLLLHNSTGKIGLILVDEGLVRPLDSLKNQVRKLGNAVEFVTSTEPVIVVAPPTTADALLEILKTFIWRGGFSLKDVALEKVERLMGLVDPIEHQINAVIENVQTLQPLMGDMPTRLHKNFVSKLKESPLTTIPLAPKILLDLLEEEIEQIKSSLSMLLHKSLVLIYHIADGVSVSSSLLDCVNTFMGATKDQPFIHNDIVRGVGFIAEDTVGFRTVLINVMEALKEYNPIPFREGDLL